MSVAACHLTTFAGICSVNLYNYPWLLLTYTAIEWHFIILQLLTSTGMCWCAQVISDKHVFFRTLQMLSSGTDGSCCSPQLTGVDIDAWQLYRVVCGMGGYTQVTRNNSWRQVCTILRLPATIISKPSLLRKYYLRILQDYEQVSGRRALQRVDIATDRTCYAIANIHEGFLIPCTPSIAYTCCQDGLYACATDIVYHRYEIRSRASPSCQLRLKHQ
jgi:hypothetical protein